MDRKYKVTFLILFLIIILQFIGHSRDVSSDRKEYKDTVYDCLVSVDDIIEIMMVPDSPEEDLNSAYRSLVVRVDRLEKFIYHSGSYIDFDYQPRAIANLSYELEGIINDNSIDNTETERLKYIAGELDKLITEISIVDDDDQEVNMKLSIEEINSAIDRSISSIVN